MSPNVVLCGWAGRWHTRGINGINWGFCMIRFVVRSTGGVPEVKYPLSHVLERTCTLQNRI